MRYRVKHVCEYGALRLLVGFIRLLPYKCALTFGWCIARLGFSVFRFRRTAAQARIRQVFGDRYSSAEVRRIAWISWRNFIFSAVEMIRIPSITLGWVKSRVAGAEGPRDLLAKLAAEGKGAVVVTPHMGSWELAGIIAQLFDLPVFFITGRQKNPLVDRYLNRLRGSTGIDTVQRGSSLLKSVFKRLKNGGMLAFMPDVRAPSKEITVRFMGSEANVPAGMALFARQTGVPIVPVIMQRSGWSRHSFSACNLVYPDDKIEKAEDWRRMTQAVFSVIDEAVMQDPEQWFWFNKRWILDPVE